MEGQRGMTGSVGARACVALCTKRRQGASVRSLRGGRDQRQDVRDVLSSHGLGILGAWLRWELEPGWGTCQAVKSRR